MPDDSRLPDADEPSDPRASRTPGGRHQTDIAGRAGQLLQTSFAVWLAATAVNIVYMLAGASAGPPRVALALAVVTLFVGSLGAWGAGRIVVDRGGGAIRHGRVSRRAVGVASVTMSLAIWLALSIIAMFEAPVDPRNVASRG